MGWVDWFLQVGSAAFILVAIGEYGIRLAPAFPGGAQLITLSAVALLFLIHAAGLRAGSRSQELLSSAKAAAFIGVALVCLVAAPTEVSTVELNPRPDQVSLWVSLLVLSRAAVMVNETYAGVIGEAQWFFSRWAFLKMNSGFGLSQKVPDIAPEVGIMMSFRP